MNFWEWLDHNPLKGAMYFWALWLLFWWTVLIRPWFRLEKKKDDR
jgi:hypothetical protein